MMRLALRRRAHRGALMVAAALVPHVAFSQVVDQVPSDSFVTYATPGECAAIARRMERQYGDTHAPDTIAPAPLYHPARRETVAAVRGCVARFAIAKTPARDLPALGLAHLAAEQLPQADSAFQRWLKFLAPRPANERRWALVRIVGMYASARPARLTSALAYAARLDSLGSGAAPERLMAHMRVLPVVVHMDSVALLATEVAAALRASREMIGDTAQRYARFSQGAAVALADLQSRRGDGVGARRVVDSAAAVFRKLCPGAIWPWPNYQLWSLPAPEIQATRWFNDSIGGRRPTFGRRSLVLFPDFTCTSNQCFAMYATLRRLRARYPDLDVTLVTLTRGAYGTHLIAPEEEMQGNRRYFFDEQRLPGALAVWKTVFHRRALDRGLVAEPNPTWEAYQPALWHASSGIDAILVDRDGIIRMYDALTPDTELRWRNVIAETP